MREHLLDFMSAHPQDRARDKVSDLGDPRQWLSVAELLDNSIAWKQDLARAMIVELMRRQDLVGWGTIFCKHVRGLSRGVIRKRAGPRKMVPRVETSPVKCSGHGNASTPASWSVSSKRELLDLWWC